MLDLKLIRETPKQVQERLDQRSGSYSLQDILDLDGQQRQIQTTRNQMQARSNEIAKQIKIKIKGGSDPNGPDVASLKAEGAALKGELAKLEPQERDFKSQIEQRVLSLPNLPDATVPLGANETENVEVKVWGDDHKPQGDAFKTHWELGKDLGILEFERAVKIAQSRFVNLWGVGAALERAIASFMLDTQVAAGYTEVMPPVLVSTASLTGTGQLPKFAEESFKCAEDDLWLTPTAEVPLTNLYREEVLDSTVLPIHHCAFTPCFRREAGSYGKDTRGLIRLHQFNKVEMVKIVHPDTSMAELETMLGNATAILEALKLPYRVIELCTGDLGFSACKCYDVEVWLPSAATYREISSCSNCWDFQARRANIRFKEAGQKGTRYVHTLNGSGLAVGRTMAAILENYQQPDGSLQVPEVLQTYLKRDVIRVEG
ncbi:MAG: serine--tRNA ligase [Cyanobacteria bacterium P01_G01_bin.54]